MTRKHCFESTCGTIKEHKKDCRPGRPLCRWRRRPFLCGCDAYHYPHRKNGGLCNEANRWRAQYNDDTIDNYLRGKHEPSVSEQRASNQAEGEPAPLRRLRPDAEV